MEVKYFLVYDWLAVARKAWLEGHIGRYTLAMGNAAEARRRADA